MMRPGRTGQAGITQAHRHRQDALHVITRAARRSVRFLAAGALLTGLTVGPALLAAGTADAAACGGPVVAGTPCTLAGTLTFTGGTLSLTSPTALAWSTTLAGLNSTLVDSTAGHTSFVVNDASGSGAGWNVTVSATTFTTGAKSLANSGTLQLTGSTSAESATTAPDAACNSGSTCTLPVNGTAYPVLISTAASSPTPVKIYSSSLTNGLGQMTIGNANPVGWWLNVPANTIAGTYTSTFTWQIASGP